MAMLDETHERRRHTRRTVYEPCRVMVDDGEYPGAVVNMSVNGAAIQLDVQLDAQPEPGTAATLIVERIGRIPIRVVRQLVDGIAVEFSIGRDRRNRRLAAAIMEVLNEFAR